MNSKSENLENRLKELEKQVLFLQNSQNLYAQVLDSETDSIFAIDLEYRLLMNNKHYQQLLLDTGGHQLMPGESILPEAYSTDILDWWKSQYNRAFSGEALSFENEWTYLNGIQHTNECCISPLRNTEGMIFGALVVIRDITKQKVADKRIRESEARYRKLAENLPETTVAFLNNELCVNFVTGKEIEVAQQDADYFIGRNITSIFPQHICDYAVPYFKKAFNGEPQAFEIRYSNAQFAEIVIVPIFETDGSIVEIQVISQNITKRKLAEEKLRKHEELLNLMGQVAHIGGWDFDIESGEGNWTDEVALIHDMQPNDPTNRDIGLSFYKNESRLQIETAIHDAIEHAWPYDLELELVTAVGNQKWVRTIGLPVVENGKVVKLEGSIQDITQLKQAEIELQRVSSTLQNIINSNPETIIMVDREFKIIATNTTFSNRLNLPVHEVAGHSYFDFVPEHLSTKRKEHIEKVFITGEPTQMEDFRNDLFLEHFLYPVFENGEVVNVAMFIRNITERKMSDDRIRQNEKQYRYLFENNPLPMWAYDTESLKFLAVNNVAIDKYGYSREEFLNMTISDIRPASEMSKLHENLSEPRNPIQSTGN